MELALEPRRTHRRARYRLRSRSRPRRPAGGTGAHLRPFLPRRRSQDTHRPRPRDRPPGRGGARRKRRRRHRLRRPSGLHAATADRGQCAEPLAREFAKATLGKEWLISARLRQRCSPKHVAEHLARRASRYLYAARCSRTSSADPSAARRRRPTPRRSGIHGGAASSARKPRRASHGIEAAAAFRRRFSRRITSSPPRPNRSCRRTYSRVERVVDRAMLAVAGGSASR